MKKPSALKPVSSRRAKLALGASLLVAPVMLAPLAAHAQKDTTSATTTTTTTTTTSLRSSGALQKDHAARLFPIKGTSIYQKGRDGTLTVADVAGGNVIFKTAAGEYFYIKGRSGDIVSVTSDYTVKLSNANGKAAHVKWSGQVSLLGVDENGNVWQQDQRGESFYLDAKTGDKVFAK